MNPNTISLRSMHGAINNARDLFEVSFETMGEITLKKQAGIKYSIGEISNWVTKLTLLTQDPEAARRAFEADKMSPGTKENYIGLSLKDSNDVEDFKNETTKAKICYVSYVLDKKCIEEFQRCVWSDKNVIKFLEDMVKIGRLYQEKTIDYAKKINFLDIVPSPMRFVTLLSLKPMEVKLAGKEIVVYLPQFEDDANHIIVNDLIHKTRVAFSEEYKEYVEEVVIPELEQAKLPDKMDAGLQRLRYAAENSAFLEIKEYYKDVVGGYMRVANLDSSEEDESISIAKEAFKSDKARLENMLRMVTRYMTPEQRGAYMKYIAGRTKGNNKREDGSENRFYLSICRQEFLKWLISLGLNEIDYAGYKLLGNKEYVEGDIVWFENGQAGKAIIDGNYTGALTIKDIDGVLYGTVDINDLIEVPEVTNQIIMKVQQGFVKDNGADRIVRALNSSQRCTFKPDNGSYVLEVERADGKKTNIPYAFGPAFTNTFKGLSGNIVKVSKNVVNTATGAEVESVYVSIDLDVLPEVMIPAGSAIEISEEDFEIVETDAL